MPDQIIVDPSPSSAHREHIQTAHDIVCDDTRAWPLPWRVSHGGGVYVDVRAGVKEVYEGRSQQVDMLA